MAEALYNPDQWLARAEELRTMADCSCDDQARALLLRLSADYELLADRCKARRDARDRLTSAS